MSVQFISGNMEEALDISALCEIRTRLDTIYVDLVYHCFLHAAPEPMYDTRGRLMDEYIGLYKDNIKGVREHTKDIKDIVNTMLRNNVFYYSDEMRSSSKFMFGQYDTRSVFTGWYDRMMSIYTRDMQVGVDLKRSIENTLLNTYDAFLVLCQTRMLIDMCVMMQQKCEICGKTDEFIYACEGCTRAWYCGEKCQRAAWLSHKLSCERKDRYRDHV
jgi:hypothetical protein